MNKLSNVMAWRRNAAKRIQQALEELADALNPQRESRPVPIPVRVPVRGSPRLGSPRRFSTFCAGLGAAGIRNANLCPKRFFSTFMPRPELFFKFNVNNKARLFSKYKWFFNVCNSNRFFSSCSRGQSLKNSLHRGGSGFMFGNFSQSYQNPFRLKLHTKNLHLTYRSIFCQVKDMFSSFDQQTQVQSLKPKAASRYLALFDVVKRFRETLNHKIVLNSSCSPENHKMTLELARTDSSATPEERAVFDHVSNGSYIEFPINFDISIPDETILNDEVLEELLVNVKRFQTKLAEFKNDIVCLFELGELPIKYVKERQVLRVYFPNCDYAKLELLCREKNVSGGYIYEDFGDEFASGARPSTAPIILGMQEDRVMSSGAVSELNGSNPLSSAASTVVSQDDILSSSLYESDDCCSTASSCFSFEDDVMLSSEIVHPLSNEEVVRLDYVVLPQVNAVSMHSDEFDDYYWVAA